jgi:hypothetical protein
LYEKMSDFFVLRTLNAFPPFGSFLIESPHAKSDRNEK